MLGSTNSEGHARILEGMCACQIRSRQLLSGELLTLRPQDQHLEALLVAQVQPSSAVLQSIEHRQHAHRCWAVRCPLMVIAHWMRTSSAGRMLSSTASASLETLRQTTQSNPGSGIPPGKQGLSSHVVYYM